MPSTESWGKDDLDPADPEFAAKVRALLGSRMLSRGPTINIDPSKAHKAWSFKNDLLGVGLNPEDPLPEPIGRLAALLSTGIWMKPGNVYGLGDKVSPQTWAHEFRHQRGIGDERTNRILDAAYSGSSKQWNEALNSYGWFMKGVDPKYRDATREDTLALLHKDISDIFGKNSETLPYNIFLRKEPGWEMLGMMQSPIKKEKRTRK